MLTVGYLSAFAFSAASLISLVLSGALTSASVRAWSEFCAAFISAVVASKYVAGISVISAQICQ